MAKKNEHKKSFLNAVHGKTKIADDAPFTREEIDEICAQCYLASFQPGAMPLDTFSSAIWGEAYKRWKERQDAKQPMPDEYEQYLRRELAELEQRKQMFHEKQNNTQ